MRESAAMPSAGGSASAGVPTARALAIGAVAVVLLGALAVRLVLLVQPIGGDPAIYAYVASRWLEGAMPYADVFEQKPPGVLFTYAAAFAALGRSMLAVQILDVASWLVTCVLVGAIAWRLWREPAVTAAAVSLAAVFINPTLQSGFKQVGQAEAFIAMWAAAGVLFASGAGPRRESRRSRLATNAAWLLAGICVGVAALYKYNAVTYLLPCAVAVWAGGDARSLLRASVVLVAGCLVPLVTMAAFFAASGALDDLIAATVLYNVGYTAGAYESAGDFVRRAAVVTYRFATMNVLWLAGGAGCLLLVWRALRGDRAALVPVSFVAAAYVAILLNARFYPQYFLQILPPLTLAGAYFLTAVARLGTSGRRLLVPVAVALFLIVSIVRHTPVSRLAASVAGAWQYATGAFDRETYYARFGELGAGDFSLLADYRLAEFLRRETRPEESVYIYGGEALVLFLAERRTPSKFVWNDPYTAGAYAGRFGEADLVRELEADPPAYFIVLRHDGNLVDPVDSLTHFRRSPTLQAYVARHFREVGWLEDFLLFEARNRRQNGRGAS